VPELDLLFSRKLYAPNPEHVCVALGRKMEESKAAKEERVAKMPPHDDNMLQTGKNPPAAQGSGASHKKVPFHIFFRFTLQCQRNCHLRRAAAINRFSRLLRTWMTACTTCQRPFAPPSMPKG
jgi:hypothetical protein